MQQTLQPPLLCIVTIFIIRNYKQQQEKYRKGLKNRTQISPGTGGDKRVLGPLELELSIGSCELPNTGTKN